MNYYTHRPDNGTIREQWTWLTDRYDWLDVLSLLFVLGAVLVFILPMFLKFVMGVI